MMAKESARRPAVGRIRSARKGSEKSDSHIRPAGDHQEHKANWKRMGRMKCMKRIEVIMQLVKKE